MAMKNRAITPNVLICIAIVMVLVNSLRLYGFGLAEILLGFAVLGSLVVIHILLNRTNIENN